MSRESPSPLPALPVQYLDYTLWQQHVSQREAFEAQLRYWKQHLQDAPPTLELPTNRLRPAIQTFAGAHQSFTLAPEISVALVSLSRRAGVTLFMTLLSAFACLLWRYSGQDDLLIGTPIANRRQRELEDLIGFFVNTLVLRVDIADNPTVHTLLARVREITLQAYAHQDVPFEQLVETLAPERVLRHTPLVQIMFSLQHASGPPLELAGLNVQPLPVDGQNAKFDLTLSMQDTKQGLEGTLHYNSDLFEATTIERMATHFQQIVEGMIADPEQNVGDLPLLTEAERQLLLVDWNATRLPFPHTTCLHQHFESQVERTPSAIALVCDQEHLSYQELNQRANQLAHRLRRLGVGPEVVVGVCLPRSLSLVIGALAILKAGGAYLPLDPDAPAERLRFMIRRVRPPCCSRRASSLLASQMRRRACSAWTRKRSRLREERTLSGRDLPISWPT